VNQRGGIDAMHNASKGAQNDEWKRRNNSRNSEIPERHPALEEGLNSNTAKRKEQRPAGQKPKKPINAAAWGSLKPHMTLKKSEQAKSAKKATKPKQTSSQTTNQIISTPEQEIARDTVLRGRLPKFRKSRETVETNSNPDVESATQRSGSPSRHEK
jgi:hypothetical protein